MLVSLVPVHDIMIPQTFPESCTNGSQVLPRGPNVPKASALAVVLALFIVFGVMGNVLVILSVVCHRTLRSATHYFIANLAVADLLLSCTVLPFSVVSETLGRWVFGRTFCGVWAAMDVLCCTASIMSLCVISVDRYIGVSFPLRYPSMVTERRALLVLAMLWVLAVTISIGPLVGWKEPPPEDESVCQITEEPGYAIFSALGSFYLPLVVILSMYCRVYVVARRETRGLMSGQKTQRWDASSGAVTLRIHRGNATAPDDEVLRNRMHLTLRLLRFSREKKAAKTLGIVVGCFIVCWLPFFLVLPIGSIFPRYRPSDTVFKITFWLGYFNSCINPIIYPCSSQEFKKAFVSILGARCLRSRSRRLLSPRPRRSHLLATSARLSPSASAALFSSSSSRDGVECQALFQTSSTGTTMVRVGTCGQDLLRTCCCSHGSLRIHQPSPCRDGDAV